ncbi:hypothetical protein CLIB1444_20S00826 [[Candida] jaroonii]|uniref:Uncharacterized protein n=1 Tax=[Candida] jaroonii TaxID=467808 RepID=A0ACA9YFF6_9ASCO|nr:hypothetical protein CLIB1444_20S00826 [[Candida] jaroonii]
MFKQLSATLVLISTALAASSSELPTLTSTIISSTCDSASCGASSTLELAPSSFAYSNDTTTAIRLPTDPASAAADPASAAADPASIDVSSSKARSTIYEYATVTTDDIFEVVKTICDTQSNCYATTDLESFTTYTTTVDGILTVITTGVPYTSDVDSSVVSTTTAAEIITTLDETITVTKTHCDTVCHLTTEVEVLATFTSTVGGTETIFTTYCPLSTEAAESITTAPAPTSDSTETATDIKTTVVTITSCKDHKCTEVPVTTGLTTVTKDSTIYTTYCPLTTETTSSLGTVDVITNNIVTETPVKPTTVASVVQQSSSAFSINTYEGAGMMVKSGLLTVLVSFSLSLI